LVLLLGATGYTGRLVGKLLLESHIPTLFSGTSAEKLTAAYPQHNTLTLDLMQEEDLKKIPSGVSVVINCAGPFNLYSKKLLHELSDKGVLYLDITGEQSFVKYSFENFQHAKSTYLHACAFESFFADALAHRLVDSQTQLKDLTSFYYLADPHPSPGTRLTLQTAKYFDTYIYRDQKLEPQSPASISFPMSFEPFKHLVSLFAPYPEILFYPRTHNTQNASSYFIVEEYMVAQLSAGPAVNAKPIEQVIRKYKNASFIGPDEDVRKKELFTVSVQATFMDGTIKVIQLSGYDTYGLTAKILLEIVKLNTDMPGGVWAPSQVINTNRILDNLIATSSLQLKTFSHSPSQDLRTPSPSLS
jgi:short subunit dehydrogenase-like uncharacterized protein